MQSGGKWGVGVWWWRGVGGSHFHFARWNGEKNPTRSFHFRCQMQKSRAERQRFLFLFPLSLCVENFPKILLLLIEAKRRERKVGGVQRGDHDDCLGFWIFGPCIWFLVPCSLLPVCVCLFARKPTTITPKNAHSLHYNAKFSIAHLWHLLFTIKVL